MHIFGKPSSPLAVYILNGWSLRLSQAQPKIFSPSGKTIFSSFGSIFTPFQQGNLSRIKSDLRQAQDFKLKMTRVRQKKVNLSQVPNGQKTWLSKVSLLRFAQLDNFILVCLLGFLFGQSRLDYIAIQLGLIRLVFHFVAQDSKCLKSKRPKS